MNIGRSIAQELERIQRSFAAVGSTAQLSADVVRSITAVSSATSTWLTQWNLSQESIRKFIELTANELDAALQKAEVLGALGWTIPIDCTHQEFVAITDSAVDAVSADEAFTWFYEAHDWKRFDALKKRLLGSVVLHQWKPALDECFANFSDQRYRSCTALLLPMVEGVIPLKFPSESFSKEKQREAFFTDKLQAVPKDSFEKYLWLSYRGFINTVFKAVPNFANRPATLNRHWILHGRGIAESNLSDVLRLLQALDTVADLT